MAKPVTVSDNIYKENLLNNLYDFSKNGLYTDITMLVRDLEITAHRAVLAAASEVFATMFQVDMKEKFEGVVKLDPFGLSNQTICDLVKYIYTGRLDISVENVEELLACANFFMISRLKDDCCEFMMEVLDTNNCLGILTIASKYGCEKLKDRASILVQEEFDTVVAEEEFLHLSKDEVYELLSSDVIEVKSEDVVFKALLKWLDFDLVNRSQYFETLFGCIRVQFLSDICFSSVNFGSNKDLHAEAFLARQIYMSSHGSELLAVGRNTLPRRCLDTSIVIMTTGGYDGNSCLLSSFVYPVGMNKWGHLAPMLVSRHDHGTVSLRNRIYVIGGFNSHRGPLNHAEFFNSIRNEWTSVPPMNFKRKSLGVCVYDGKIFVSGGLDGNYNALETVESYDPEQEVWTTFTSMNQARYSHGFVANEKGLFAIGGWKLSTGERFHEGRWSMIAPLSVPRAGATSIIRNNKIYVFGGYSNAQCVSSVEIYDIELDFWTNGSSSRISRWRAGSAVVDNTIYVIGGRNSSWQYLDAVETYDLENDAWEEQQALPCKIMGLRCSVVKVPKYSIR